MNDSSILSEKNMIELPILIDKKENKNDKFEEYTILNDYYKKKLEEFDKIIKERDYIENKLSIISIKDLFHDFDTYRYRVLSSNEEPSKEQNKINNKKKQFDEEIEAVMTEISQLKNDDRNEIKNNDIEPNNSNDKSSKKKDKKKTIERATGCFDYFFNLVLFMFLLFILNLTILWSFYIFISQPKNNFYCLDIFAKEFKICERPFKLKDNEYALFIYNGD